MLEGEESEITHPVLSLWKDFESLGKEHPRLQWHVQSTEQDGTRSHIHGLLHTDISGKAFWYITGRLHNKKTLRFKIVLIEKNKVCWGLKGGKRRQV